MTPYQEQLKKEFLEKLPHDDDCTKYDTDFEICDCDTDNTFDFFLLKMRERDEKIENAITKEMPMAWFPESAGHLKKQFLEEVLEILKSNQ